MADTSPPPSPGPGPSSADADERARVLDRARARVGVVLAPVSLLAVLAIPLPGLDPAAHRLAAIAVMAVVLWISEAIPLAVTALLIPALAVVFDVAPAKVAFAPFAHPLLFLFIGGFMLAEALALHGIDRRLALRLLASRAVGASPRRVLMAVAVTAFVFSMWINNTATTAMMLPIAVGLCGTLRKQCPAEAEAQTRQRRFEEGMVLCLAYAATLGGVCTPVGTAPNLIAIGSLEKSVGVEIDFLQWMQFGVPVGLAALALLLALAWVRWPPAIERVEGLTDSVRSELQRLGPTSPAERRTVAIFAVAVGGWLVPSCLRLIAGAESQAATWAKQALPEGVVALLAAALLFVVPGGGAGDRREPLMKWSDAVRIDWGTVLLMGGGLALGNLAIETGLADAIGREVDAWMGDEPVEFALLVVVAALVLYLTELVSNTATTNMMVPVVIPIAARAGFDPVPVVLTATLAASFAFMLPVSTPPNAIVYGSGLVRMRAMIRFGFVMDLLGLLLLIAAGWWLLPAVRFW